MSTVFIPWPFHSCSINASTLCRMRYSSLASSPDSPIQPPIFRGMPMFEHNDLKANPDGVYYKVFGKLSAGDITSAQAAEDLMKGIDDCYNF